MSGPLIPRWTHVALPAANIQSSIDWYEAFTPLRLLSRREDAISESCWLAAPEATDKPFVLVLVSPKADGDKIRPTLSPFAHIGIELPTRDGVDEVAARGRDAGCLRSEPMQLPEPVGYICALVDPDGNVIEFSHDQRVYDAVAERWGLSD